MDGGSRVGLPNRANVHRKLQIRRRRSWIFGQISNWPKESCQQITRQIAGTRSPTNICPLGPEKRLRLVPFSRRISAVPKGSVIDQKSTAFTQLMFLVYETLVPIGQTSQPTPTILPNKPWALSSTTRCYTGARVSEWHPSRNPPRVMDRHNALVRVRGVSRCQPHPCSTYRTDIGKNNACAAQREGIRRGNKSKRGTITSSQAGY